MRRLIQTLSLAISLTLFLTVGSVLFSSVSTQKADALSPCPSGTGTACYEASAPPCTDLNTCPLIQNYVDPLIKFLAAAVGVAVVISIIIGGIQYTSSAGDPSKAGAAKDRIRNAIIALVAFILLYGMLNFLIPGGLGGA